MSGEGEQEQESGEAGPDSGSMKALLRSLPKVDEGAPLLPKVQRSLRRRSRGKFYGDRWSLGEGRVHYALLSGVMLVIVAVAYVVLGPTDFRIP